MGIQDYLLDAEKLKDEGRAFNVKSTLMRTTEILLRILFDLKCFKSSDLMYYFLL
jgi:hypothetical protein